MRDQHAAFVGSIPENYDRYLGPCLFKPYASDIAQRVKVPEGGSVLELACGTGIVSLELRNSLPKSVRLVATDLNEAMLAYAARKFESNQTIEWHQADATELPFPDDSFNAVVCQFGLMFVPDKEKALREVYRVLVPEGLFVFNVWDAIERNELAHTANEIIRNFFEQDPPTFYQAPFGLCEEELVHGLLRNAGFGATQVSTLPKIGISPSAAEVAKGLIEGNPVIVEINERATSSVQSIESAVAAAVASRCGDNPVRSKMQAIVYAARR